MLVAPDSHSHVPISNPEGGDPLVRHKMRTLAMAKCRHQKIFTAVNNGVCVRVITRN